MTGREESRAQAEQMIVDQLVGGVRRTPPSAKKPHRLPLGTRLWLWFRWVVLVFAVCCGLAAACGLVMGVIEAWNVWWWPWAAVLTAAVASLAFGTLIYFIDRNDSPQMYR